MVLDLGKFNGVFFHWCCEISCRGVIWICDGMKNIGPLMVDTSISYTSKEFEMHVFVITKLVFGSENKKEILKIILKLFVSSLPDRFRYFVSQFRLAFVAIQFCILQGILNDFTDIILMHVYDDDLNQQEFKSEAILFQRSWLYWGSRRRCNVFHVHKQTTFVQHAAFFCFEAHSHLYLRLMQEHHGWQNYL